MSLLKKWKLILLALTVALFAACAGSGGGSGDDYSGDGSEEVSGGSGKKAAPKEVIDENKLKNTEKEAVAITEDNHKLRKEIFDAKNKLGIPVERPSAE